ncbi:hypothetical protein [Methanothrix sp.]|uniref:hypothetical protein n=1 Tax=Methanothrix sp. TaxID=90426 RepID=UPI003BB7935C
MDHIVRINERSDTKTPIVLHLLPGEETLFNLVVINNGEPSDVSLQASDPVFKAVRFRRPDDYVDGKQIIPIFARMPDDTDRLDGEIILKSSIGESRVPITILRDSMVSKSDQLPGTQPEGLGRHGPSDRLGRVPSRARIRDIAPAEEAQTEDYREEETNSDEDEIGADEIGPEIIDPESMDDDGEDEDRSPYESSEDLDTEFVPAKDGRDEEDERDSRNISFSKDQDLERYRSARRFRRIEDLSETDGDNHSQERIGPVRDNEYSREADDYFGGDDYPDRDRIDRPIDPLTSQTQGSNGELDPFKTPREDRRFLRDEAAQDPENLFRPGVRREPLGSVEREENSTEQFESDQIRSEEEAGEVAEGEDGLRAIGAMQIIPAVIFFGLVSALVLTFITESIPEFPGALVSSILIVTLIIYGAATLLKA